MKRKEDSESKKKKSSKKRKKKKTAKEQPAKDENTPLPQNIQPVPENIKHLVNVNDFMLCVEPDGACAFNSTAGHIFEDPKEGPKLRSVINLHISDRWSYYETKIQFPIKGKLVSKENGFILRNQKNFLSFFATTPKLTSFGLIPKNCM